MALIGVLNSLGNELRVGGIDKTLYPGPILNVFSGKYKQNIDNTMPSDMEHPGGHLHGPLTIESIFSL